MYVSRMGGYHVTDNSLPTAFSLGYRAGSLHKRVGAM